MTTEQQSTVQLVRDWVKQDNELKQLQKEVKIRKKQKLILSNTLIDIMKDTNTGCYELKNGVLMYTVKNVKKPMTQKMMMNVLQQYYGGDIMKATHLNEYILSHREEVVQEKLIFTP